MVAQHGNRASGSQRSNGIKHPGWISTVADKVAEKGKALGTSRPCMLEHGLQRLAIRMQVSDQGGFHDQNMPDWADASV